MTGVFGFRLENRQGKQQIEGLRELQRALRQLGDDTKTAMKPTHQEAADIVAEAARGKAPVRTGRLRRSVKGSAVMSGGRVRIGYGGGAPSLYAGPIHFGWPARRIRPQPFVYDALDPKRPDVLRLYERRIDELTKKYDLR
jgi:HK97 gp10 family phage protein